MISLVIVLLLFFVNGQKVCGDNGRQDIDVIYIIDESGSVTPADFNKSLNFAKDSYGQAVPSGGKTALMTFDDDALWHWKFEHDVDNETKFQQKIVNIEQRGQGTNFKDPFQKALEYFQTDGSQENFKLIIFITDGKANSGACCVNGVDQVQWAEEHKGRVKVAVISIGNEFVDDDINCIVNTSDPKELYWHIDNYTLDDIKQEFEERVCESFVSIELEWATIQNLSNADTKGFGLAEQVATFLDVSPSQVVVKETTTQSLMIVLQNLPMTNFSGFSDAGSAVNLAMTNAIRNLKDIEGKQFKEPTVAVCFCIDTTCQNRGTCPDRRRALSNDLQIAEIIMENQDIYDPYEQTVEMVDSDPFVFPTEEIMPLMTSELEQETGATADLISENTEQSTTVSVLNVSSEETESTQKLVDLISDRNDVAQITTSNIVEVIELFNECLGEGKGHDCHRNATCEDTKDSYICTCNQGSIGDGKSCDVVDACKTSKCGNPHTVCRDFEDSTDDTKSGRECICPFWKGYTGDGDTCAPPAGLENECNGEGTGNDCDENATCIDDIDGYMCLCKKGYEGDGKNCSESFSWSIGQWDPCPVVCGLNPLFQRRPVVCYSEVDFRLVPDFACAHEEKASTEELCEQIPCVCLCANGVPEDSCPYKDMQVCKSCDDGFEMVGETCEQGRVCNQQPPQDSDASSCTLAWMDNCTSQCNAGFSDATYPNGKTYQCISGVFMDDSKSLNCTENQCVCVNGVAATGADCPFDGGHKCVSCDPDAHCKLSGDQCDCYFEEGACLQAETTTLNYAHEVGWSITSGATTICSSSTLVSNSSSTEECCLQGGVSYTLQLTDTYGDGWNGALLTISDLRYMIDGGYYIAPEFELLSGSVLEYQFTIAGWANCGDQSDQCFCDTQLDNCAVVCQALDDDCKENKVIPTGEVMSAP